MLIASAAGVCSLGDSARNVAREDTVIFDIDNDDPLANPTNFNPLVPHYQEPARNQLCGSPVHPTTKPAKSALVGESFTPNDTQELDAQDSRSSIGRWYAVGADDVVFTINMLLGDTTVTWRRRQHCSSVSQR